MGKRVLRYGGVQPRRDFFLREGKAHMYPRWGALPFLCLSPMSPGVRGVGGTLYKSAAELEPGGLTHVSHLKART